MFKKIAGLRELFYVTLASIPVITCAVFLFPSLALAANNLVIYPYTISAGNIDASSATITWQTNLAGTSSISYGLTTSYSSTGASLVSSTTHSVTITGLSAATTYHYELFSYDSNGDIATSSDQTFITVNACTYYVDSISGSDSNNGTDANTPFQHLVAVPAVSSGAVICLKRGSTFKDSLIIGLPGTTSPINNVTVRDYGLANLPMPLIDNSDTIAPGAWSLAPGTSNTYQATVPGPGTGTTTPYGVFITSGATWINIWECKSVPCTATGAGGNDTFLANETSTSSVDSTAGSYYVPGMTISNPPTNSNSLTIYMHTSDGTNPGSNGYAYTYSNRTTGIDIYGNNAVVDNIVVKKSSGNGGGFGNNSLDGSSMTFNNIEADQMGKHSLICSGGCTVNNSKFVDEYYNGGNMFVSFDQVGSGLPITLNNDIFLNGVITSGNAITATYGHVAGGSESNLIVNGGLVEGITASSAFNGVSASAFKETVGGLTCDNTTGCVIGYGTTTLSNVQDYEPVSTGQTSLLSINGGATNAVVTVASSSACDDSGYNHNVIGTVGAGNAVTVASSTIYVLGTVGGVTGVGFGGAGSSLHLYNTLMDALPSTFDSWVGDSSATSSAPYFGNYNTFPTNMWQGAVNGTAYHPLSAWQTAVFPQDANSTTTSPTPNAQTIACTLHQIAFSGPSSGTVNTASSNFTLTPSTGYNSVGVPIGYIGTVTITPSGTGSTGLTPVTLTFNAAASTTAQTFTILPTATGSIALTESDNGATTSPDFLASTTLTYTSNITTPGAPYGPILATAGNTTATVSWSAPVSIGGSNITSYTVVSAPGNISTTTSGTSAVLTGLTNGQAYTFTITATNAAGTSASSTASNQITPSTLPSVTTSAATAITTTSVTVTGAITATNGPNPTQSGFIYTTDPSLIINISTTTLGAQTGTTTLSQSLSSLICNTTYYFEAYAANVSGTGYGTAQNFTTSACPVATVATSPTAGQEGGSVSASELARLLAPGPATTAYLESIGELPPTTATGASASTPGMFASSFTHYLKISQTGSEVKALQEYLNDNGYILTNSGPGSPGSETDMFGSLTKAALVKFQKAHGLPATGYFGPMTIGVING